MDIDWCLNCNCHTDGTDPYCSDECKSWAGPSSPVNFSYSSRPSPLWSLADGEDAFYEPLPSFSGQSQAGIRAWASMIPQGAAATESMEDDDSSLSTFSSTSAFRPPKLLRKQRPVSPTLCMSTLIPVTPPPSKPVLSSQRQKIALTSKTVKGVRSMDAISLSSSITESTIATPSTRASPVVKQKRPLASDHIFSNDPTGENCSTHHSLLKLPPYLDGLYIHAISSF
ncbi:hypothetical protein AX15_001438 [Amanita polypyramis BW_CC]|nr:hypothetical protein AX15_001438 [Amanita polypyramis BW_CC]